MKQCLPKNTKISKGAKENAQACVSEFVLFVTSEASDKCQREKRKTIGGEDILWALATLGFEDFVPKLHEFLIKYREVRKPRKGERKGGGGRGEVSEYLTWRKL